MMVVLPLSRCIAHKCYSSVLNDPLIILYLVIIGISRLNLHTGYRVYSTHERTNQDNCAVRFEAVKVVIGVNLSYTVIERTITIEVIVAVDFCLR